MVIKEGKKVKLEELLLKEKVNDSLLFIVAEQGVAQHTEDVHIVMNPRIKNKVRLWLVNEYLLALFEHDTENETSVRVEDINSNIKYNKKLKEFLYPRLQQKEAKEFKHFRKKMKTYAQVLGIQIQS